MITRHTGELYGQDIFSHSCACGWTSDVHRDPDAADAEVREHLADEHGDQLDVGRCEKCRQPTEHFRAVTQFGTLYLCETHSPAMSDLDVAVPAP